MGSITVYNNKWHPTVVPFMGPHADVKLLWQDQLHAAAHRVRGYIRIMRHKKVDAAAKCAVVVSKVLTEAAYETVVSAWSYQFVGKLSNVISFLIRESLGLPVSYPYALIHSTVGGIGFIRFATHVLLNRERSLLRCLAGPGGGAAAARGCLTRVFRNTGQDTGLGLGDACSTAESPLDSRFYVSSLLQAGWQRALTLWCHGIDTGLVHVGARWKTFSNALRQWLCEYDIQYLEELVRPGTTTLREWIRYPRVPRNGALLAELQDLVDVGTSLEPIPVTRGHHLVFHGGPFGDGDSASVFLVDGILDYHGDITGQWACVATLPTPDGHEGRMLELVPESTCLQGVVRAGRCP